MKTPFLFKLHLLAVLAFAAAFLGACGQRGPLIHPDKDKLMNPPAKATAPAAAPSPQVNMPASPPASTSASPALNEPASTTPTTPATPGAQ